MRCKLPNDRNRTGDRGRDAVGPGDAYVAHRRNAPAKRSVMVDPDQSSVALSLAVKAGGGRVDALMSPITLPKAHKEPRSSCRASVTCHFEDGAAWTNFTAWLLRRSPRPRRLGSARP